MSALRPSHVDAPTRVLLGSFPVGRPSRLHRSIREARAGEPRALAAVLEDIHRAARIACADISDGLVVPVPGHRIGTVPPIVLNVARTIAAARGWPLATDGLRRVRDVSEAKSGGRHVDAVATLAWHRAEGGSVVVLVDDVVRTGTTVRACVAAIEAAGDERPVVTLAVARARDDTSDAAAAFRADGEPAS